VDNANRRKSRSVIKESDMLKSSVILSFIAGFLFLSTFPAFPQVSRKKSIDHDIAVIAVSFAVTVQDRRGRAVNDLAREDFTVLENGEKKEITYFSRDFEAPLSLTVLLDVSGSMALLNKMEECKKVLAFLAAFLMGPQDEISLLIFADGEVEVAVDFSRTREDFLSVLEKTEAYGQTALNDAVAVSPEYANRGTNEKRALLLITDGVENDSQYSYEQAVEIAGRVDVPIYTIGYKIPMSETVLKKYKRISDLTPFGIMTSLESFSEATGGRAFFLTQPEELRPVFIQIKQELSYQYILGYTSHSDPTGGFRQIDVIPSKRRFRVRTREGYYSGDKSPEKLPERSEAAQGVDGKRGSQDATGSQKDPGGEYIFKKKGDGRSGYKPASPHREA